jgi:DNA uptake protein ComE-like DNA-binding protein
MTFSMTDIWQYPIWKDRKNRGILCVAAGVILLALGIFLTYHLLSSRVSSPPAVVEAPSHIEVLPQVSPQAQLIWVDVAGAVKKPGVYSLPTDSRVSDALQLAGGVASRADLEFFYQNINLAQKITDQQKIFIPFRGNGEVQAAQGVATSPLSLATASQKELETLPGIGPAKAEQIVSNRPYLRWEDFITRNKISSSLEAKIKPLVKM